MSSLLSYLSTIKLSLTQLLIGALAAVAGILALALKFKEEELRRTQVKLLESHFNNSQTKFDQEFSAAHAKVQTSQEKYEKALNAYHAVVAAKP